MLTHIRNPSRRALLRSQILRESASSSPIPPSYFTSMSTHLSQAFESGLYLKDGPPSTSANGSASAASSSSSPANPLDPSAMEGMMGGLKTQAVMMVPQMLLMGWINFFFQGFVLSALSRFLFSCYSYFYSRTILLTIF